MTRPNYIYETYNLLSNRNAFLTQNDIPQKK